MTPGYVHLVLDHPHDVDSSLRRLAHCRYKASSGPPNSYDTDDFGAEILNSYEGTEFAGLRGPIHSEMLPVAYLLFEPTIEHPTHSCQAEEVYVLL